MGSEYPVQQFNTSDPIVAEMLGHFRECETHDAKVRQDATKCHSFFVGGEQQWADTVLAAYRAQERPDLTFNQLPQFVYNILNEQLQNPSEIQFSPDTNGADEETARVLQDIARKIRTCEQGQYAIDHAHRDHILGGFGYFRICTDYVSDDSTYQFIYLEPIESCFSVYFDPNATFPTYKDAKFCIVFHDMSKQEFQRKYPGARMGSIAGIDGKENEWIQRDTVRIAEYIKVHEKKETRYHLADGRRVSRETYMLMATVAAQNNAIPPQFVIDANGKPETSEIVKRRVVSHKMSAYEQLEKPQEWAGSFIPIVPVMGEQVIVNGERYVKGLLYDMLDPQVATNFMQNEELLQIAIASKSPWLLPEGAMENNEDQWKTANRKVWSALTYKAFDSEQRPLPPPIRNNTEPPVQATQLALNSLNFSMQQCAGGIYQNALGDQQSVNESGRAVIERKKQSKFGTFRFTSELNRAIKYLGEQLEELIPRVLDVPQILELEGVDRKKYKAMVYNAQAQGMQIQHDQRIMQGIKGVFDLSKGNYGIAVSSGPGYETQRLETQAFYETLAQAWPQGIPQFIDLWARSMDFAEHDELADRLMPANIALKNGDNPAAMVPALQNENQQLTQMVQHLSQLLQQLTLEKQAKHDDNAAKIILQKMKSASDEKVAQQDSITKLLQLMAAMGQTDAKTLLDHEVSRIEADQDRQHEHTQNRLAEQHERMMAELFQNPGTGTVQ